MSQDCVLIGPTRYAELCPDGRSLLLSHGIELIENPGLHPFTATELADHLPSIDAAVVGLELWPVEVFEAAPRLRVLARHGVGLDNIDLAAAQRHGVSVTNVPGGNANAVAELAIGLILSVYRSIPLMDAAIRRGHWDRFTGYEIAGKTVGLIGFGATAQALARRLAGFDVRLLAYDPYLDQERATQLNTKPSTLSEIAASADIVSLHLPHTTATHRLVDADFLDTLRPSAILINVARGGLVDPVALHDALISGVIAGAGLDVWDIEPVPAAEPLLKLENVVGTTHGAADTYEAYQTVGLATAQSVLDVLAGRTPLNLRTQ